jgi:hypothetical protein
MLPDFIIIGTTKGGTTALWYNLDKHPDITMATKSPDSIELNFWAGKTRKRGIEWYESRFKGSKLNGEKTPAYLEKKGCIRQIHNFIPECKLILCLRNPVDRAYSNFQMNRNKGKVREFNLNAFKKRYSRSGKYFNHIQSNVLPFFKKSNLHVVVTEWMKEDPTTEMKKVFDFLGVNDLALPKKIIGGVLLKNRTRQEDIKKNKGEDYYRVWSKHTEVLKGPMRKEILNFYKDFNNQLFNFLGYEIKEWN